jgi:hypothetical protein
MTRLRQRAVREPRDRALAERIGHNARGALLVRALLGALTLVLLALGAALASCGLPWIGRPRRPAVL